VGRLVVVGLSVADPVITKLVTPEAVSHLLAVGWPVGVVSDPPPSGTIGISTETLGTAWQIFGASHYGIARFEVSVPTVLLRRNSWQIPTAAQGGFGARAARKSDDTAEKLKPDGFRSHDARTACRCAQLIKR
jgi:hypothetical protein